MTVRNRRRPSCWPLFLLALLLPLGGCETLEKFVSASDRPDARIRGARITDLTLQDAVLAFDVEVSNPYGVSLPLTDLSYSIASDGMTFLTGDAPFSGSIPARSSRTVTLPASVRFQDMLSILNTVRPGQVIPYNADLQLKANAPGIGPVSLPVSRSGDLPIPNVPNVQVDGVDWTSLSLDSAQAVVRLRVDNTNEFPIDLNTMQYALALGGMNVADASVVDSVKFDASGSRVIEIPISVTPRDLGLAAFQMFTGNGASYDIGGNMSVGTPFGPLDLPFQRSGQAPFAR